MNHKNIFRVFVALNLSSVAGNKKLNGLHRFLGEGYDWDMEIFRSDRETSDFSLRADEIANYDGFLISQQSSLVLNDILNNTSSPIVIIDYPTRTPRLNNPRLVFIHENDIAVSRAALGPILSLRGHKTVAYVPTRTPSKWSTARQNALKNELYKRGLNLAIYNGDGNSRNDLVDWLKRLPKPVGIIAAFDDRARDIADACRTANINIPDDVALMGIGNDETICEMSRPPISSVAIDFEQEGYCAARELQAMMLTRRKPLKREILFGPQDIVMRRSLPIFSPKALVRRAQSFIDENATNGIVVEDVVSFLHVSRRLADMRFKEETGATILSAILTRRLEAVKRLLTGTDLSVEQVAQRCGYKDTNYLKNQFKRLTGMTMTAWRRGHRNI